MVGRFVTLKLRKKCAPEPAARENRSFPMSEKKITLVNIYNFIRMSHQEPSEFLEADFDTIARQIRLLKQYGLPSTYALKYDALTDPRYQALLKENTDENDEIAAWWEITEPMCRRAGVPFPGKDSEIFDERVDSAYSVGYEPEDRKRLVDAYMEEFLRVFGRYPKTIGSWVLDPVTIAYAQSRYGVLGAAICRDQMGTDGFTLWGGYPNGIYFPSRKNEYLPAQTASEQIPVAMFRLLSPDPVFSFEQDVREGLSGVYTLEPCCTNGRDPNRISWYFNCLTREDRCGVGYAQVGQENNFLWENIRPGFEPQLKLLKELSQKGEIRVETMAESARWFSGKYALTPPMSWSSSRDWEGRPVLQEASPRKTSPGETPPANGSSGFPGALWYACENYRIGFLGENGRLRIRDWFLYDQDYPSRYLKEGLLRQGRRAASEGRPLPSACSVSDALPLLFAQKWMDRKAAGSARPQRPFVRLLENGSEPSGEISFFSPDEWTSCALLTAGNRRYLFRMFREGLTIERFPIPDGGSGAQPDRPDPSVFSLRFDFLPVLEGVDGQTVRLRWEGHPYGFSVARGRAFLPAPGQLEIASGEGMISLRLSARAAKAAKASAGFDSAGPDPADFVLTEAYRRDPRKADGFVPRWMRFPPDPAQAPATEPRFSPADTVFPLCASPAAPAGSTAPMASVVLSSPNPGAEVRYTLDKTEPDSGSPLYRSPLKLSGDTVVSARAFLPDGRVSETASACYRFGFDDLSLKSDTVFDGRPTFCRDGIRGLLLPERGSLDYQDGRWLATLQDLDFVCTLPEERFLETVEVGFLSHHRSGIVYPDYLELYLGDDENSLALSDTLRLPCRPAQREICRADFGFHPRKKARCLRFVAHRYPLMPQWCCYKGTPGVFMLADRLIVQGSPAGR